MTVFYVLMYRLWIRAYGNPGSKGLGSAVYALALIRVILCAMPQNNWLENGGSVVWGIIRNVPFVALGVIIVCLFFRTRKDIPAFRPVWLLVSLSFLFYIPVALAAPLLPILGMLMLPKTVCYMVLIGLFLKVSRKQQIKEP